MWESHINYPLFRSRRFCVCVLLIWYFHFIFIPFYSNLHPPLLSRSNFFVFLVFSFYLEFGCVFTSYVCLCSTVYRCSFEAAHVFLSFLHFISFSIPQLPPPFTCSLHSICYVLFFTVNSITSNSLCFSLLSFFCYACLLLLSFSLNFKACTVRTRNGIRL